MVYIGLDDESRTKGKAAIDVVAAQSGKSASSLLQQALLIATSGTVASILPVLAVFYSVMLTRWTAAVKELAEHYDPARVHRLSIMGSVDEEDEAGAGGADAAGGAAALVPDAAAA
jgi:AAA family ATP:ADP antiporter